jgi:hypothetical protein
LWRPRGQCPDLFGPGISVKRHTGRTKTGEATLLQVIRFIHTEIEATFGTNSTNVFQFLISRLRNKELDLHLNPLNILHSTRLALEEGLAHMTNRVITFFPNDGGKAIVRNADLPF